ncbi:aminotransferase [Rhodobacteraceae bacterium NNCM2]|nr:aminotransferase [Coraliihabitans acroporae]
MPDPAINPNLARVFAPPVMEARRWLDEADFSDALPLVNVSQAAPVDPPPPALTEVMARAVIERPDAHLYGPVLGNTDLRARIASDWSKHYQGAISTEQVAITAGCNQAFCTAATTICGPGDALMIAVPWYFNHKMWLDMAGVESRLIPCHANMLPDIEAARAAMDDKVKGILLITPNNPTGAEYPNGLMEAFFDLAQERGISLIVDETYRDFHSLDGAPHTLFQRDGWEETLIHLYSFSKVFRLTGHRVGALITGKGKLVEAEKFLDTVTICPNQLGQIAALHGLTAMGNWVAGERAEILDRRAALVEFFARDLPDWKVLGAGAYFAYVEHPFDMASDILAKRLVNEQAVLALPGTMFTPDDPKWGGARQLRIAFANVDRPGLAELTRRLAAFSA